jgi:hypothetical protein
MSSPPMAAPVPMAVTRWDRRMPTARPIMAAVMPPEPWKGTMTKSTSAAHSPARSTGLPSSARPPLDSMNVMYRPRNGTRFASGKLSEMNSAHATSTTVTR